MAPFKKSATIFPHNLDLFIFLRTSSRDTYQYGSIILFVKLQFTFF